MPSGPEVVSESTRAALAEMLRQAAPAVVAMVSYTAMQFLDGLMVSRIGPDPGYVAAQGNGGAASFIPVSVMLGLLSMVNTYVAQSLGAGTPRQAPAYAWTGLWLVLVAWIFVLIPYGVFLPDIFHLVAPDHEPHVHAMEVSYGRVLIFAGGFTMASRCLAQFFYGLHRPSVVLVSALAGNLFNLVGNTLFIFGPTPPASTGIPMVDSWLHFWAGIAQALHIPQLGVTGAAVSTALGTILELSIPLAVFLGPKLHAALGTRHAWRFSLPHARRLIRFGWPGAVMFGNEMICWAYLMAVLIGHFGPVHNSAGWIALRYMHLAFMPAIGVSFAVTAQVGKCMGAGRPDLAQHRAYLGLVINMGYMGLCAVFFVLFRREAIALFAEPDMLPNRRAELLSVGAGVMIAASIFQLFDALGITISSALRGAGDTVWPGAITVALAWSCLVAGGTYLAFRQPQFGSLGPWAAASAYIILLGVALYVRFLRGKWKLRRLVDPAHH